MEEIASDEQSEFSLAGSSLPAALYLGYERLVRFRFFKCFFQLTGNNRFDDMQLPPHVFDLSRRLRQAVRQIDTTYYVLDHSCFKHWVNAIRSFRAMRLISEGCVRGARGGVAADARRTGGDRLTAGSRTDGVGVPLHIGRRSGGGRAAICPAGGAERQDGGLFGQFAAGPPIRTCSHVSNSGYWPCGAFRRSSHQAGSCGSSASSRSDAPWCRSWMRNREREGL